MGHVGEYDLRTQARLWLEFAAMFNSNMIHDPEDSS